jgi:hypothetical protein
LTGSGREWSGATVGEWKYVWQQRQLPWQNCRNTWSEIDAEKDKNKKMIDNGNNNNNNNNNNNKRI